MGVCVVLSKKSQEHWTQTRLGNEDQPIKTVHIIVKVKKCILMEKRKKKINLHCMKDKYT